MLFASCRRVRRVLTLHNDFSSSYGGMSSDEFKCFVLAPRLLQGLAPAVTHLEEGELVLALEASARGAGERCGGKTDGNGFQVLSHQLRAGVTAVLIEHTASMCAWTTVRDQRGIVSTADLRIDYLEPSLLDQGILCEAKVFHMGSKLVRVEAAVFDAERRKLATGRGLFHVRTGTEDVAESWRSFRKQEEEQS